MELPHLVETLIEAMTEHGLREYVPAVESRAAPLAKRFGETLEADVDMNTKYLRVRGYCSSAPGLPDDTERWRPVVARVWTVFVRLLGDHQVATTSEPPPPTGPLTEDAILEQLDWAAAEFVFPMLDNGYSYHVTQRLTALRDECRWALVIEIVSCGTRGWGLDNLDLILHRFGNCLVPDRSPGTSNHDFLYVFEDGPSAPLFFEDDDAEPGLLNPAATDFRIRDGAFDRYVTLPVPRDHSHYAARGVEAPELPALLAHQFMRGLLPEQRLRMLALPPELRRWRTADLTRVLVLDEWNHPDLADEEKPSESETFRQLAKAMVTGDAALYAPTQAPNTHWSNWPDGGTL